MRGVGACSPQADSEDGPKLERGTGPDLPLRVPDHARVHSRGRGDQRSAARLRDRSGNAGNPHVNTVRIYEAAYACGMQVGGVQ